MCIALINCTKKIFTFIKTEAKMVELWGLLLLIVAATCQDEPEPGEESETCLCVPYYQCLDKIIVTDGSGILDPRGSGSTGSHLYDKKFVASSPKLTGVSKCGPYHVCCLDPESSGITPYRHKCGNRNPAGTNPFAPPPNETSIAEFGEWPWQAVVLRQDPDDLIYKCGGVLIDDRHILTAAQCVYKFLEDKLTMVIRLGAWHITEPDVHMPHEDYGVAEIFMHERYNPQNLHNDIAVVRLNKTVEFKSYIDTICLPDDNDDFTGHSCVATGWGSDTYIKFRPSVILKEVTLPIISNDQCQGLLRGTRLGSRFRLHKSFLCAGGKKDEDVCKGDGGGPLVCYKADNSYTLAGLVSWGVECGEERIPGVYTDVSKFLDFITCKTQKPMKEYLRS